jgi:two-component system phosphate regulon sensor histidine kinase PhoR
LKSRYRSLWLLLALALAASIAAYFGTDALRRAQVREHVHARLTAEADLLATIVNTRTDLEAFAHEAGRRLQLRVSLIDENGRVVGDSERETSSLSRMDDHRKRPEIEGARLQGTGWAQRESATTGVEYFYHAQRTAGSGPVRYVRVALALDRLEGSGAPGPGWRALLPMTLSFALLATIGYLLLRRVSKPLERLADGVEQAADRGNPLPSPDRFRGDVARLAAALRASHERVKQKLTAVENERAALTGVVAGMQEGLLLVNAGGRVQLANEALRKILVLRTDPEGRPLAEIIRNPSLLEDIERTIRGEQAAVESVLRLPGSGKAFEIRVNRIPSGDGGDGGALVLWLDITRLESLERVRRDFVANVSHELRTPLTAIQAATEALLDQDGDDGDKALQFLQIVRRNADYMGAMVEDLTDLSLIETGAVTAELRPVDAHEVTRSIAERLEMMAAERSVEILLELPQPFVLHADRRRLEQILENLVNNALKFTPPGGHVRVQAERMATHDVITVSDDGIGIPSQSIDKIFHRFYQVDPERSRHAGGTGLGLALVKHLIRLHGGTVHAESELGEGSRFVLEFPREGDAEDQAGPVVASLGSDSS